VIRRGCTGEGVGGGRNGEGAGGGGQRPGAAADSGAQEGRGGRCARGQRCVGRGKRPGRALHVGARTPGRALRVEARTPSPGAGRRWPVNRGESGARTPRGACAPRMAGLPAPVLLGRRAHTAGEAPAPPGTRGRARATMLAPRAGDASAPGPPCLRRVPGTRLRCGERARAAGAEGRRARCGGRGRAAGEQGVAAARLLARRRRAWPAAAREGPSAARAVAAGVGEGAAWGGAVGGSMAASRRRWGGRVEPARAGEERRRCGRRGGEGGGDGWEKGGHPQREG
jgi:hypothetical protein